MEFVDINTLKENEIVKFITPEKTLVDGIIKKISSDCLGITINSRQDSYLILSKDQPVKIILINKHQAIKCSSVVLACTQNDHEQVVLISKPQVLLGIERREYERLPIVMDIEYSLLPAEVNYERLNAVESKYLRSLKKSYTVNISAGGVYFVLPKIESDSKLAIISLNIKSENIISLCEQIRLDHTDDTKHQRAAYKFNDIKTNHRQLILDFVSEKLKDSAEFK
jgi:c-di-GMP-binding flagellar brake protein YcgR